MIWLRSGSKAGDEHDQRDGEGGYLASASDLMIGLLFIFIILVVVLALEQRKQEQQLQEQLVQEKLLQEQLLQEKRLQEKLLQEKLIQELLLQDQSNAFIGAGDPRRFVTDVIGTKLAAALPGARLDLESGVISLPESVLFDLGSAQLNAYGRDALTQASGMLAVALPCFVASQRGNEDCDTSNPFGHEIEAIFIEGHTDSVPLLRAGYDNTNLSLDRARSVQSVLVQGTKLEDYRNANGHPLFSLSAYADMRPLAGTAPTDQRNRRVDLRVVLAYKPIEELLPNLRN